MFTDAKGSTDLWRAHPKGTRLAHRLQRDAIESAVEPPPSSRDTVDVYVNASAHVIDVAPSMVNIAEMV
jgi:hypothetical protein